MVTRLRRSTSSAPSTSFNPETDITWHSLFWAEGTDFVAQGYSDTDNVTLWPNETAESDLDTCLGLRYTASDATLGQPVVEHPTGVGNGHAKSAAFTANPSYTSGISVVAVMRSAWATGSFLFDGIASSNRNALYCVSPNRASVYAGDTTVNSGSSVINGAHFVRVTFDGSTGNETAWVDGVKETDGNAGDHTLTGLTLFNRQVSSTSFDMVGSIALLGLYEGDITADDSWSDFETWVSDHYGITIA